MLTRAAAEALTAYAVNRRGWDAAGCIAQLGKVRDRHADDVAMAWVRFCADSTVRTPGAFPNPTGPHWKERVSEPEPFRPPRKHEVCWDCNQRIERCACGTRRQRPIETSAVADEHIRSLRGIYRTAVADLCKHGPACRDCAQPAHEPPHDLPESEAPDA